MTYAFLEDSSFNRSDMIYNIIKSIGCESYLELGLYDGNTINKINTIVPHCVGVDIIPVNITGTFFLGTTDDFFKINKETFDIIFIDANHSLKSAEKDFNNSLKILNKYGIIFIHDTDPISEKYTLQGYCGDSYKLIDMLNENKELNCITLPVLAAGLTIINRKSDRRSFIYANN